MAEELKLIRTWASPFALRAVHALKFKALEYETIFEDITNKSALLLKYNPVHKKVPVLVHNGKPICESLVILEYIDETWKHRPLLPQDPYEKAQARFWAKFADEKLYVSIWNAFIAQGKEQEEPFAAAVENLKLIEEQLKGKKFFGGETMGYLDIALGWTGPYLSIVDEICDLKLVDEEKLPLLCTWIKNFSDDPIIKECWPPRDKMVVKFQLMREPYIKKV